MVLSLFNYICFDGIDLFRIATTNNALLIKKYDTNIPFWKVMHIVMTYVFIPSFGEEIFFRGLIIRRMRKSRMSDFAVVSLGSVMFALAHMSFTKFLPMLFLSIIITAYYVKFQKITVCIFSHILYNLVGTILEYFVPLPSSSSFISSKYASADETKLWGVRYASIGLTVGILIVVMFLYYINKNAALSTSESVCIVDETKIVTEDERNSRMEEHHQEKENEILGKNR